MKYFYFLSLIIVLALYSCGNSGKNKEPETETVDFGKTKINTSTETDAKFKDPWTAEIFQKYLELKNALVLSDSQKASAAAIALVTIFATTPSDKSVMRSAQNIVESNDIEEQRNFFVAVTTAMESMLQGALEEGVIYKQYCPMAFKNAGASWLSNTEEINNPYFGDKMLKCGRVEAEIQ